MIAIFLFYNQATGKQDKYAFSKYFRHVDLYTFARSHWVVHRFDRHGVSYFVSKFTNGGQIISHLIAVPSIVRIVALDVHTKTNFRWLPLWGRTCNELARYLSGVDIGLTYSPRHLYAKLLRYDHRRNYEILTLWRRHLWVSSAEITKMTTPTS
jgi:hypothetical protein